MKKINIIKEKNDFDSAFKKRTQIKTKYSYIYINENNINIYRFGICISKKIGNAVHRNKLKRRIKDIIDKSQLHFKNKDYIIVMKKSSSEAEYLDLKDDLLSGLKKISE